MAKGYIFVDIPEKCENCFCARRYGDRSLGPDGVVCRTFYFCAARFSNTKDADIDECSVDLTGAKPDWCPIKPVKSGSRKFEPTVKFPTIVYPGGSRPTRGMTYVP